MVKKDNNELPIIESEKPIDFMSKKYTLELGILLLIIVVSGFIGYVFYHIVDKGFTLYHPSVNETEIAEHFCIDLQGYRSLYDLQLIMDTYYIVKCERVMNYSFSIDEFDIYKDEFMSLK